MKLTQIDLLRILESVDPNLAVDVIISSEPYQQIVATQTELVTIIQNILFDQFDFYGFGDQLKSLYAQNIRSVIAYVTGNTLAAGTTFQDDIKDLRESFIELFKNFFEEEEETEEEEPPPEVDLQSKLAAAKKKYFDQLNADSKIEQRRCDAGGPGSNVNCAIARSISKDLQLFNQFFKDLI